MKEFEWYMEAIQNLKEHLEIYKLDYSKELDILGGIENNIRVCRYVYGDG